MKDWRDLATLAILIYVIGEIIDRFTDCSDIVLCVAFIIAVLLGFASILVRKKEMDNYKSPDNSDKF